MNSDVDNLGHGKEERWREFLDRFVWHPSRGSIEFSRHLATSSSPRPSFQDYWSHEADPYYLQFGISFATSMHFNGVWKKYWESIKEGEEPELASQVAQDDLFGESSTVVPDKHYEEESSQ
ncbi:hypothetical protein AN958_08633 [Leucoagaricus sp. SymC.cos]|nr:hypothetical protein AN958_08633 [Leucoagaricus sp. SymC.cos]